MVCGGSIMIGGCLGRLAGSLVKRCRWSMLYSRQRVAGAACKHLYCFLGPYINCCVAGQKVPLVPQRVGVGLGGGGGGTSNHEPAVFPGAYAVVGAAAVLSAAQVEKDRRKEARDEGQGTRRLRGLVQHSITRKVKKIRRVTGMADSAQSACAVKGVRQRGP